MAGLVLKLFLTLDSGFPTFWPQTTSFVWCFWKIPFPEWWHFLEVFASIWTNGRMLSEVFFQQWCSGLSGAFLGNDAFESGHEGGRGSSLLVACHFCPVAVWGCFSSDHGILPGYLNWDWMCTGTSYLTYLQFYSYLIWLWGYDSIPSNLHIVSHSQPRTFHAWDQKWRLRWSLWLYRSTARRKSWTPGYLGPIENSDFVGLPGFGFGVVCLLGGGGSGQFSICIIFISAD